MKQLSDMLNGMHVYFSGIGGTGIGPLALIAHQAGFQVSGSDKQDSEYIHYLQKQGLHNIHIGQTTEAILAVHQDKPIEWLVYSSALEKENATHPELLFAHENDIRATKRDGFITHLLNQKELAMCAVAGTHGKTTTTAMAVWLAQQSGIPLSYSLGAKIPYGEMGAYDPDSTYFAYECDEYDRNFLQFHPKLSLIAGIDYDHPDIYPTRKSYYDAFHEFIAQSFHTVLWQSDAERLQLKPSKHLTILQDDDPRLEKFTIAGKVNRRNALLVCVAFEHEFNLTFDDAATHMNQFPGVSRRFEVIAPGLISDYAHTPRKIEGALQLAHEIAEDRVVVVYEGLHNTRQHFIREDLAHLFDSVQKLYVVPSYLAREDPALVLLSPEDIISLTSQPSKGVASLLDQDLKQSIENEIENGNIVLALSAGGGGSLDEWLRKEFLKS